MIDKSTFGTLTAVFHTFGCKLNFAETSTIASLFASKGIRRSAPGETPDFIVVNSCSVTDLADKKCRQYIRSVHRRYPDTPIILTGCYAQLKPEEAGGLPGVAIVAGADRKNEIAGYLEEYIRTREPRSHITPLKDIRTFSPSCSRGDRTRFFLKVQDGCDYWCTYCTIPRARGRSRSGTVAQMTALAEEAAAQGGREIVITGVNIGDFGKGTGETFLDLVRALDRIEGIERYRISSIEPNLLTPEIIEFVAGSRSFMPHFHIPLQSGSDEVLRLMHRHYDTALFRSRIGMIKEFMPDAFIGVDIIAGSRGETEEEFDKSLDFVRSLPVSRLHVFTYSERPGTRALEIGHCVSQQDKHIRTHRLLNLSDEKLRKFSERFIGTVRPVLLEHPKAGHPMTGFTDNYLKVAVSGATPEMDNRIVPVRITSVGDDLETMNGEIVL